MKKELSPNDQHRFDVFARTNGKCALCGHEIDNKTFKEHQIDPSGGEHYTNKVGLCIACDKDKGKRNFEEYRNLIKHTLKKLEKKSPDYNRAIRYRLIKERMPQIKFYYEKLGL